MWQTRFWVSVWVIREISWKQQEIFKVFFVTGDICGEQYLGLSSFDEPVLGCISVITI